MRRGCFPVMREPFVESRWFGSDRIPCKYHEFPSVLASVPSLALLRKEESTRHQRGPCTHAYSSPRFFLVFVATQPVPFLRAKVPPNFFALFCLFRLLIFLQFLCIFLGDLQTFSACGPANSLLFFGNWNFQWFLLHFCLFWILEFQYFSHSHTVKYGKDEQWKRGKYQWNLRRYSQQIRTNLCFFQYRSIGFFCTSFLKKSISQSCRSLHLFRNHQRISNQKIV